MTDRTIELSIPADDEGFIALRCPYCAADFKACASDLQSFSGSDLFCARCGLSHDASRFWPPEVFELAEIHAANYAAEKVNRMLAKMERQFRGSRHIGMKATRLPAKSIPELRAITDMATAEVPCCETTVKLPFDQAASLFYCPFCGQAQD